jgi:hypothetical protein
MAQDRLLAAQDLFHRLSFGELVINLSRYRISRMVGSSTSSTRTPQTVPVISERAGFIAGAWAKKSSKLVPLAS